MQSNDTYQKRKPQGASPDNYYQSDGSWLKFPDLRQWAQETGNPERRIVVIEDWEEMPGFQDRPPQIVLSFDLPEDDPMHGKKFGLNITNHKRLRNLIGKNPDGKWKSYEQWRGYGFQLLISTTTMQNGSESECLRVNEGTIYTPAQVKARRAKATANQRAVAAQSPVRPSAPVAQQSFDEAVPPDDMDDDEPFDGQF